MSCLISHKQILVNAGATIQSNAYGETPLDNAAKFQDVFDFLSSTLQHPITEQRPSPKTTSAQDTELVLSTTTTTTTLEAERRITPIDNDAPPLYSPRGSAEQTTQAPEQESSSPRQPAKSSPRQPAKSSPRQPAKSVLPLPTTTTLIPLTYATSTTIKPSVNELFYVCSNEFVQHNPSSSPVYFFSLWKKSLENYAHEKILETIKISENDHKLFVEQSAPNVATFIQNTINTIRNTEKNNNPLLYWASSWGRIDVVKWLLEHGADVHIRQDHGSTPLHVASYRKHFPICQVKSKLLLLLSLFLLLLLTCQLLVQYGAKTDTPRNSGNEIPVQGLSAEQIQELKGIEKSVQQKQ